MSSIFFKVNHLSALALYDYFDIAQMWGHQLKKKKPLAIILVLTLSFTAWALAFRIPLSPDSAPDLLQASISISIIHKNRERLQNTNRPWKYYLIRHISKTVVSSGNLGSLVV